MVPRMTWEKKMTMDQIIQAADEMIYDAAVMIFVENHTNLLPETDGRALKLYHDMMQRKKETGRVRNAFNFIEAVEGEEIAQKWRDRRERYIDKLQMAFRVGFYAENERFPTA